MLRGAEASASDNYFESGGATMSEARQAYSEDTLIEQPAIELLKSIGWTHTNCFAETFGGTGTLGRKSDRDVVLTAKLLPALKRLNPTLPPTAISLAVEDITRDRSAMSLAAANREIYALLKGGVRVKYNDPQRGMVDENVQVIDWNDPARNDFFLASQLWVSGTVYRRRADLVGFVNGIPILFIELKAAHRRLENAFKDNLRDYKDTIPHLLWANGFIILSNGSESRMGSITADWERFSEWKKINAEGERGVVSLETMVRGTCEPSKLLDLVENFTLFAEVGGGVIKIVAKNHQLLGVNNAIDSVVGIKQNQGKLGVFWHTQGSGKSYSMVFFAQKVLRKVPGNWTFVVVTDREELDGQIYKTFASVGAVTEAEERVRADSGKHLRDLLGEDHRYLFTLIHKFNLTQGEKTTGINVYPRLSDRSDVICMTDEAHRSQYDLLALNMRNALPKAAFIGFTGTPLIKGQEQRTKEVFGDYVSVYDFRQSVADQATVPLFYENRIPELQLVNTQLNEDMEKLLEDAELDADQEKKLEREFGREYHLITREDRLDTIAADVVRHFVGRGFRGKAMFIAIDKATAVRMYDKVKVQWAKQLAELQQKLSKAAQVERDAIADRVAFMESTDMAVVVSQAQNEIDDFKKLGLDIKTHRERMVKEDLETKFKDSDDPLRLVFVCAMWITGFDVPSCSTVYLDKPMKNHTLMQTIARANRVWKDKVNGLIVDYVGVFRDLQRALAIYGGGGASGGGESPVQPKAELVEMLKTAIQQTSDFCKERDVNVNKLLGSAGFERIALIDDAVEAIVINDETQKRYLSMANFVRRIYRAILPDPAANDFAAEVMLFWVIAEKIRSGIDPPDIAKVMEQVEELLDRSVAADSYVIQAAQEPQAKYLDLSQIDFEALRKAFEQSRKHTEIMKLRNLVEQTLQQLIDLNPTRVDYLEKFQKLIDEYNAGSANTDAIYEQLLTFAQALSDEQKRHIKEQLSEEELALFDILTKPRPEITAKEEGEVKAVARALLVTLKNEKLVLDWRSRQQTRASVKLCIEELLDKLPRAYTPELYQDKCQAVYQHVYDHYTGVDVSRYSV
jgi:type I restriction enzyme, R subunit